jgi:hypothetical protein
MGKMTTLAIIAFWLTVTVATQGVVLSGRNKQIRTMHQKMREEKICCLCKHQKADLEMRFGNPKCTKCFVEGDGIPGKYYEVLEEFK